MKYQCTVIFDASASIEVEAATPEEAAEIAEDETSGYQSLCHQCANTLETGDAVGVLVYNEESTDQLLDTTRKPQPAQRKPLTDGQINKAAMKLAECMDYPWAQMPEQGKQSMREHAKAIAEAAHGIKGAA